MKEIKDIINENKLALSTLITFTRAEHTIHKKELETIKESGLTTAQFGVLEALYNKGDLRICEIIETITDSGKKIIEDILPKHIENINEIFSVLTKEEQITLKNILKKFKNI